MSYKTLERDRAPLVDDASTQRWFSLRQDVPIGFKMLVIKNNQVTSVHEPGMQWTSVIPIVHKRFGKMVLVDVRDRFETLNFPDELFTRDQSLIKITFVVHYRVNDPEQIALRVKDPIGQLCSRTRARLVDITIRTSIEDFINKGTAIYLENLAPLAAALGEIGLDLIRAEVTNLTLPESAQRKYAQVMGQSREMQMEVDRLRALKEGGVIGEYMQLKLIESLGTSNFPPMQLYAMQMLGPQVQGQNRPTGSVGPNVSVPPGTSAPSPPTGGATPPARGTNQSFNTPAARPSSGGSSDMSGSQGTMVKRVSGSGPSLTDISTGRTFALDRDIVTAGRDQDCDIILADEYASRKHAQFVREGGELLVVNLSSSVPIVINDKTEVPPGGRALLHADDVLEIGYTKLRLQSV